LDGFRFQVMKERLYSRHGAEYTDRLLGMVEAFAELPARAAILDGELCLPDCRSAAMSQARLLTPPVALEFAL
jgi:ATP-dependent DNA ligase